MEPFWKFLIENKEFLFGSGIVIVVLGAFWRIALWLLREWRIRQFRGTPFPFKTLPPNSNIVSAILDVSSGDPLPPSTLPYQTRVAGRDTLNELEKILNERHWILILGETGTGKTREAAELAQRLNRQGWTVLHLTQTELVNEPAALPQELNGCDRQLLFFLDDLNRKMWRGKSERLNLPADLAQQFQMPLQDRLARYLEKIQHFCGENEVRVIATARNETERERADEPSEWEKLEWDKYPRFWQRFARYPLPRADETAQTNVLQAAITQTGVATDLDDAGLRHVARTNAGSLRNLIENVKNAKVENRPFTAQNFTPMPNQTWQERYRRVIQKFPAARYVYDAVDLLRTTGIDLYDFTVQPAARLMAGGNIIQRGWQIRRAARYLINAEHILEPSDGQIEAKENRVDATPYLPALTQLVLKATNQHPRAMRGSLFGLTITLYNAKRFELAERLMRQAIMLDPNDAKNYHGLAHVLSADADRQKEAEEAFRKAIELEPQQAEHQYCLGNLLAGLGRTADAEAEYRQAIRLDPNLAQAHNNLGNLLAKDAARTADAEAEYRQAIRLDPNLAAAYGSLAYLLRMQNRFDEAEPFYRRAVELDPNNPRRYFGLTMLLRQTGREAETLPLLEKMLQLDPQDSDTLLALASVHKKLGHPAESAQFAAQARADATRGLVQSGVLGIGVRQCGCCNRTFTLRQGG